ncbi:MAG: hypothetical protein HGA39_01775 [Coriobacteriia bacterium]|nr:hypothetical protein [Coriobacteriia bacterium]
MSVFVYSMFALGLVTSVHCVSMCGPLILSYAVKGDAEGAWGHRLAPHAAYHVARFISYAIVGLLLGAVGAFFDFDRVRPWALFAAGVLMVVLGIGLTGRVPWALRLMPEPPKFLVSALRRTRRKAKSDAETGEASLATPAMFGLLTGLMPCGPLVGAELMAAASGSAVTGALGMLAFGVGTAPLLVAFGTSASLIPKRFRDRLSLGLAVVLIVFGLVFFNRGLVLVGSPVTFETARQAVTHALKSPSQEQTNWSVAQDGVVEVAIEFASMEFTPRTVEIPANRSVRLIVDRRNDPAVGACGDPGPKVKQVEVPQLHILQDIAPSTLTAVPIPPTKAGTYVMTCGSGMAQATIVVVDAQ